MRKRVSSLKLLGKNWTIFIDSSIEDDGLCVFDKRHILISSESSRPLGHVFFHEILHAMFFEAGSSNLALSLEGEEMLVDSVGRQLYENYAKISRLLK